MNDDITDRTMGDHQRKTNRKTRVGQKRTECPTENTPDKGFENVRAALQQRLGMAMGGDVGEKLKLREDIGRKYLRQRS